MAFNLSLKIDTNVELPKLCFVRQKFKTNPPLDIKQSVFCEMEKEKNRGMIKPGMKIAVAVGSRGIRNLDKIVYEVIQNLKRLGANPFIFPAMGSHGGAVAEGQREVLEHYGITEENMGCPVRCTMDTVCLGYTPSGNYPVYLDKYASEADGIVIINRVKAHTDFKGDIESGILKMMTIGMGNHLGASTAHFIGFAKFADLVIPEFSKVMIDNANILFGVAILENAYDETAKIEIIPSGELHEREGKLLAESKKNMPRLLPREFDLLIIEEIGKNITGAGMDPNVVGRPSSGLPGYDVPDYQKLVLFNITKESDGNAIGMGMADIITKSFYESIDYNSTYINNITSTTIRASAIPMIMPTEKEAVVVGVKCCTGILPKDARIVYIKNTLDLNTIVVSEPLYHQIKDNPDIELVSGPFEIEFDGEGKLITKPDAWKKHH